LKRRTAKRFSSIAAHRFFAGSHRFVQRSQLRDRRWF
jgi:hypothetical protein